MRSVFIAATIFLITGTVLSQTPTSVSGADLGNHSYSHPDFNNVPLAQYTADIINRGYRR